MIILLYQLFPKSFPIIEQKLIKKCDLVVTTADELMNAKSTFNQNTISIPKWQM